jgi:hypothetical protein
MGILEDQYRRAAASLMPEQGRAALLQPPEGGGPAPLPPPAEPVPVEPAAPRGAALLNTPTAGQRLRASLPQPAAGLANTQYDRAMASEQFDTPHAAQPRPDLRAGLPQPGAGVANAQYDRAMAGPRPALPAAAPAAPAVPAAAVDPRAAFNSQPGEALGQAQEQVRTARNLNNAPNPNGVRAAALAPPEPTGPLSMDQKLGAATMRYAEPDTGYADAVRARAGGGSAPPPPGGIPPGAAPGAAPSGPSGPSAYARFMEGASAQAKPLVPPGSGLIGKAAVAAGSGTLALARKATPWVEPVIEAGRVAKVAADPETSKADVATQAAEGVGRGAATIAGAGIGGQVGLLAAPFLGPAAPAAPIVGSIIGGGAGYFGGDKAIKALRGFFGLDEASPVERVDARKASIAAAAAAEKAKPTPAQVQPAGPVMTEDQADQYSLQQQARQATKPGAPAPAAAPSGPSQGDQRQQAMLARYNALYKESQESPISSIGIGGAHNGTHISYKDGGEAVIPHGQPLPSSVQRYLDRSAEVADLMNGNWQAPAAAPGSGSAPALANPNMSENQRRILSQAQEMGYDPARALMVSSIETGGKFNHDAQNPNSSAFGLFQMLKKTRAAYSLTPEQWKDPTIQARAGIDFLKKTDAELTAKLGRAPTPAESYMGHLLGVTGASTLLSADPNASIKQVVASYDPKNAENIVNDNGMRGMTAGQAIGKWTGLAASHMSAAQRPGAVAQAGPATPGDTRDDVPEDLREQPVWEMRGMHSTVQMPSGIVVPASIYNAALASGDVNGPNSPLTRYRNALVQGQIYGVNPSQAKLDEQALQNQGTGNVAATTGQFGVQQHQVAAQGAKEVAEINTKGNRHAIVDVDTGERDNMNQPIYKKGAVDTSTGQMLGGPNPAGKQAYPAAPDEAIQELRKRKGDVVAMNSFIKNFGVEQYNKYKDGK